jgi:phosphatidylinositol alpha-1,6-mannosyltransferase
METFYEEHYRARADGVTVICESLGGRAKGLGVMQEKILKIPVGVDLAFYPTVLDKAMCREAVGVPQDYKIITFAGVDADFDLPIVLGAMKQVIEQHPETRLMITGKSNPQIQKMAVELGIAEHIITTGYIPWERFPAFLGCTDIFLLPFPNTLYNVGRWPSKVCDYMASGRPILSNPTGDIKDLFERDHVGLLVEENPEAFAAGINELLDNPALADVLGKNARKAAEERYDWKILIENLEVLYYNILATRALKIKNG